MPFLGITMLLAVIAIVHVIKTGRSQLWVMALLSLPGIGVLAYLIVEVLPELLGGRAGRKASSNIGKVLAPNRTLDEAKREYAISATAKNAVDLADIHVDKKQFAEAAPLYREALTGHNEFNPDTMHKLATCEFGMGHFDQSKTLLDQLIAKNPDYKNQDAHLLFARTQEALGDIDGATEEYEALVKYYTGPEPSYRFGKMLTEQGNEARAQALFKSVVDKAALSPKHYAAMHSEWIKLSKAELKA